MLPAFIYCLCASKSGPLDTCVNDSRYTYYQMILMQITSILINGFETSFLGFKLCNKFFIDIK